PNARVGAEGAPDAVPQAPARRQETPDQTTLRPRPSARLHRPHLAATQMQSVISHIGSHGGHHAFTFVTARPLALTLQVRLSRGFRTIGFPPACPPSYGASDSYPGRSGSCWTHQPFLDAQPYMRLSHSYGSSRGQSLSGTLPLGSVPP